MLFFWNAATMFSSHRKVRDWKTDVSVDNWTHTCRKRYVQKNSYSFQKAEEICRLRTWWARGRGRLWIHISHRPLGRASECGFHLPSPPSLSLPLPTWGANRLTFQGPVTMRSNYASRWHDRLPSPLGLVGLHRRRQAPPGDPSRASRRTISLASLTTLGMVPKPPSTYEDVTQDGRPAWPALRWRCHSHIRWCTWDASGVTLSTDSLSVFKSGKPTMRNGEAAGRRLSDHVIRR